jgi:hypothetical protein
MMQSPALTGALHARTPFWEGVFPEVPAVIPKILTPREEYVGRRSENLFKRNDVMRAIKSARDAGVPVAGVEVVCKDGTTIRVLGENAAQLQAAQDNAAGAQPWQDAITKLEAKKTTKTGKNTLTASPRSSPR